MVVQQLILTGTSAEHKIRLGHSVFIRVNIICGLILSTVDMNNNRIEFTNSNYNKDTFNNHQLRDIQYSSPLFSPYVS